MLGKENEKKTKSPAESGESRSENSADNFPLKVLYSPQNSIKKLQPISQETYQTEFFSGKKISSDEIRIR